MRRLHPLPRPDLAEAVTSIQDEYDVPRPRPPDRPWIGVCMVASLDGSIAVDGESAGLSSEHDLEVLLSLRRLADLIVVGAGTVRDEGYGAPAKPGQRVGVVTNSAAVDLDTELFRSGAGFLICPESAPVVGVDTLRVGRDHVDLGAAVHRLGEIVTDVGFVQAEGGALLNGALAQLDLIDELDVTISPLVVGGAGPRLTGGVEVDLARNFELAHLLVDDDSYLYSRWLRRRETTESTAPRATPGRE